MLRACGIVGLPNVGKSTLFNALTASKLAEASNYPFCTIEPNVARVQVPDPRLDRLAALAHSRRCVPQEMEIHDIAGLIAGASKGEGLGNKFLSHIRSVSVIVHVLRCFHDPEVLHVSADASGRTDVLDDMMVVETELMLADLASVEKRLAKRKLAADDQGLLERVHEKLAEGAPARQALGPGDDSPLALELKQQLLSFKPVLPVCNVDEDSIRDGRNDMTDAVLAETARRGDAYGAPVVVCASLEEEASNLFDSDEERADYFAEYGLAETGLTRVARSAAALLDMQVFYTVGETETRSWAIPVGSTAQEAAGKIHSDMARGFIAADTVGFDDYVACGSDKAAREAGLLRQEGRGYIVQPSDIMEFKFNV